MISKVLPALLIIALAGLTQAQTRDSVSDRTKLYALYAGFIIGPGHGTSPKGVTFNFLMTNEWGTGISWKRRSFIAEDLPLNYTSGIGLFGTSPKKPKDYFDLFSVCALKEFSTSSKLVRFGLEAGPALLYYYKAEFTPYKQPSGSWIPGTGNNYTVSYLKSQTFGISFRSKLGFPLTPIAGLELGISGNVNKIKPFLGAELGFTLGFLREYVPVNR